MDIYLGPVDLAAISPLLILFVGALIVLLIESFAPAVTAKKILGLFTAAVVILAFIAACYAPIDYNLLLTPWLKFDLITRVFSILFLLSSLLAIILSISFFEQFDASHGEFFFLILSATFGLLLIDAAANFLTLFLGIEILSISLYVLCGYMKKWNLSHEAAIKYFLMGALATALMLYGIALIYGAIGVTAFDELLTSYQGISTKTDRVLFLSGIALVTISLTFKAAIVPFHLWAPDIYEGSPTPVTAFMAVGTKIGAFAAFVRIFFKALPQFDPLWHQGVAVLAFPTLIYANIVALRQTHLRRFFAYSGISHAGFLLIPLAVGTPMALHAMIYYLVIYSLATFGGFAVLSLLDRGESGLVLSELKGLFYRSPLLATVFALCLLTLAGIPPTAGFYAKFYLFKVAFEGGLYALTIVGLLTTILSAYYYLRIITVMFSPSTQEQMQPRVSHSATLVGAVSFVAIVFLSCWSTPLLDLLQLVE